MSLDDIIKDVRSYDESYINKVYVDGIAYDLTDFADYCTEDTKFIFVTTLYDETEEIEEFYYRGLWGGVRSYNPDIDYYNGVRCLLTDIIPTHQLFVCKSIVRVDMLPMIANLIDTYMLSMVELNDKLNGISKPLKSANSNI